MEDREHKEGIQLLPMGVIYFVLFLIVWFVDQKYKIISYQNYHEDVILHWSSDVVFCVLLASMVIVASQILSKFSKLFYNLEQLFQEILGKLSLQDIFFIAAFSAVCEEYFFRGLIQYYLGLLPASLMFGLLHSGPSKRFLPWTVFATVMGFVLGSLYISFENIFIPIGVHFLINFVNLCFIQKK
ncbi:MAG TPA: type II CAAX endopeptidase family protein [Oligoflexia bacterium]|nr:type II CAAX endopeptidase family protein [Oligoflexia bacterium]HMR25322.1 type II CAAX endopeptidase family protein [Oligoflexia bacterium]